MTKDELLKEMEDLHVAKTLELKAFSIQKRVFSMEGVDAYITNYQEKVKAADRPNPETDAWLSEELKVFNAKNGLNYSLDKYKAIILYKAHHAKKTALKLSIKINFVRGFIEDAIHDLDDDLLQSDDENEISKANKIKSAIKEAYNFKHSLTLEEVRDILEGLLK